MKSSDIFKPFALSLVCAVVVACGSDETDPDLQADCPVGFVANPITGSCEPGRVEPSDAGNGGEDGGSEPDAETSNPDGGEPMPDMDEPCVDNDNDGVCAEDDCDDDEVAASPELEEICDAIDNDCDGDVNNGLDCGFYAHTQDALYIVDPFALTAEKVVDTPTTLLDIDTHPDGRLFGILSNFNLAVFNETTEVWDPLDNNLGNVGNANGLAISNLGRVFISSSGNLYTANLDTGVASLIGSYDPFVSSGDVVVTKGDNLLMTSSHSQPDTLVRLDGDTGMGTVRGSIGVDSIWGLTSAYGVLYGVTSNGQLAVINPTSGEGQVIHTFEGLSFYGAASTPDR